MPGKPFDVFLSYSHKDEAAAIELASELQGQGVSVWLDRDSVRPGDDWDQKIHESLQQSSNVVMLVSVNSLTSQSTLYEMGMAVQHAREHPDVRILPVLIGGIDNSALPGPLRSLNVIDSSGHRLEAASNEIAQIVSEAKRSQNEGEV